MHFSKTVLFARQLQIPSRTLAPSRGLAASRPVALAWRLGLCAMPAATVAAATSSTSVQRYCLAGTVLSVVTKACGTTVPCALPSIPNNFEPLGCYGAAGRA
eukprot:2269711-Rhodomonas_salina.1